VILPIETALPTDYPTEYLPTTDFPARRLSASWLIPQQARPALTIILHKTTDN
jgi:hypothetical protein